MMKSKFLFFLTNTIALTSCQIDAPKYNLGDGFYVTYVDVVSSRGVYYQRQNVNGDISVQSVIYNDSMILVKGYRLPPHSNYPDTSVSVYYGVVKDIYKANPDQTKSDGYLRNLDEFKFEELSTKLKKPEFKEWTEWR